ncbi:hypothetical protein LTR50_006313 [Elasticomyces elasticus]|nr:hypothetical protein LTR50_006313 [Elasticomyces elasticus]
MPAIAISGAGSGIGHTFLDHYSKDSNNTIYAIDVAWSDEVSDSKAAAKVTRYTTDSSSLPSVKKLAEALKGHPIDLFIHSAAVRGMVKELTEKSDDPADAETLDVMTAEVMQQTLLVNTMGSFLMIRALLPNLKAGKNPKCVIMGSRMGSIGANNNGGAYAYGPSKAGLNYIAKSLSIDVPEVIFTIIHPGKVDSRMTHVREDGAVDPEDAVAEMLPLIDGLSKKDSGKFYVREGEEIPW